MRLEMWHYSVCIFNNMFKLQLQNFHSHSCAVLQQSVQCPEASIHAAVCILYQQCLLGVQADQASTARHVLQIHDHNDIVVVPNV